MPDNTLELIRSAMVCSISTPSSGPRFRQLAADGWPRNQRNPDGFGEKSEPPPAEAVCRTSHEDTAGPLPRKARLHNRDSVRVACRY